MFPERIREDDLAKKPITIVTGFLGSGKTTLLKKALSGSYGENTAILVNEFGEIGLDHHLLRQVGERTVLLGNGCVCCGTREDLIEVLLELLDLEERGEIESLDRVVIETTGLADPAPILHTVFTHPVLQHHYIVDVVTATVDAVNGEMQIDRNPESVRQVSAADKIVVTKTDVAEWDASQMLLSRLKKINPQADIVQASFGEIDPEVLFEPAKKWRVGEAVTNGTQEPPEAHELTETYSTALTFDGPVDWTGFGIWLSMLLHARGEEVLRVKGLLDVGEAGPVVLNGVQHIIHPPEHLHAWPDDEQWSRIVFICRGIHTAEILSSLEAFGGLIGASPRSMIANDEVRV